jgi:hypothetical protein
MNPAVLTSAGEKLDFRLAGLLTYYSNGCRHKTLGRVHPHGSSLVASGRFFAAMTAAFG